MYILSAIELRGPAGPNTVRTKGLDGFLFNLFVAYEVVEVVGGKIHNVPAAGEFYSRSCWTAAVSQGRLSEIHKSLPNNDRQFLILSFLERGLWRNKWFRSPFIDQVIDLLFEKHQPTHGFRGWPETPHLFSKFHEVAFVCRVRRREEIPNEENDENELDR